MSGKVVLCMVCAGGECSLMSAGSAPKALEAPNVNKTKLIPTAAWRAQTIRPVRLFQSRCTLLLNVVETLKRGKRQTFWNRMPLRAMTMLVRA